MTWWRFEICTGHNTDTAMFWAKFQNDWTTENYVMSKLERDCTRFDYKKRLEGYPVLPHPEIQVEIKELTVEFMYSLQWRHNDHDGVSNHQPHHCLLSRLFWRRSNKTSKFRVTGLCAGNSPGPAQRASKAENVSIWWRHHVHQNTTDISTHERHGVLNNGQLDCFFNMGQVIDKVNIKFAL